MTITPCRNPRPTTNLTVRPLPRGLTSKARKRQGGRKGNRRRNRRGRPSVKVSKEPNPTTTERTQGGDDPTHTESDAISLSPHQHMDTMLSLPSAELKMEDGAACFGPNTTDGQVPPRIDQVTFIKMAGDEHEKMKKTTHDPLTARPTPPTPVTKPQSSPSLAGDDT